MDGELERIRRVNNIITGVARRVAYKFKGLDVDDISQELWLHILTTEDRKGCQLDDDLIAAICYREIVSLQRHEMLRNHYSLEVLIETSDWGQEDSSSLEEEIMIKDLYNLFPEGSKEREFLEYWGTYSRVRDGDYISDGKYNEGFSETDLSKRLGFGDSAHRGYRNFRKEMRKFVAEYFGKKT